MKKILFVLTLVSLFATGCYKDPYVYPTPTPGGPFATIPYGNWNWSSGVGFPGVMTSCTGMDGQSLLVLLDNNVSPIFWQFGVPVAFKYSLTGIHVADPQLKQVIQNRINNFGYCPVTFDITFVRDDFSPTGTQAVKTVVGVF